MDVKLENLIEKIKKDGIEEAQRSSHEITSEAKKKAKSIIEEANLEAEAIIKEAEGKAQKFKSNSEASLKQAARDLVLSLRQEIHALFDKALKIKISQDLSPEYLKELILSMVSKWSPKGDEILEILVAKSEQKKIADLVLSQIKKEAKNTIEIKTSSAVTGGFRIGIKGDSVYYDFTDESISEALKVFLNPTISAVID